MRKKHSEQYMTIGKIFTEYGTGYAAAHSLSWEQRAVMTAIQGCRTSAMGGRLYQCDDCHKEVPLYNSCGNRHCPQCQYLSKEKWLASRLHELLPVTYFHVVFTLPAELRPVALHNSRVIYGLLFKAAAETLLALGKDPKHIGADIGLIALLHTWGQGLEFHPHLHCIVPGGGLSFDQARWVEPRKSKENKPFLFHVNVLSSLFKKKFMAYLTRANQKQEIKWLGSCAHLAEAEQFKTFKAKLYSKQWVTYCKEPFSGPQKVLEYLARYSHRIAISNDRIIKVEACPEQGRRDGRVHFTWKDYKDDCKRKPTSLSIDEFIRRFLLHVLPKGFFKIRYYGILWSRHKKTKLCLCQTLLQAAVKYGDAAKVELSWQELLFELTGFDARLCPVCKKGKLRLIGELQRRAPGLAPP